MASGQTTTGSLVESLPTIIASARQVREMEGNMSQLVDRVTLGKGVGLSWTEVSYAQLTAGAINENTDLDNFQEFADTSFSITPTSIGISTFITDRVRARISPNCYQQIGKLAQNAMQRKKDQDALTMLDGATTSLSGAGTTLVSGVIAAATTRIMMNTTEPGRKPIRCVLHGYQQKDIYDELVAGVGTGIVTDGPTANVFKSGFTLPIAGTEIYVDGNITIDSSSDAKGGVFAKDAIVLVEGRALKTETLRKPNLGGGGDALYMYDEYAFGERSSGNWLYEVYSDATVPTS